MRYLMLPLLVMLAGVTFANFLYGPAGAPDPIESNIDNDSTRSDYFSSTDSLYWYNTNYNFYLRQAAATAGDRDLGIVLVEEDGTEHDIFWNDGANWWDFGSATSVRVGILKTEGGSGNYSSSYLRTDGTTYAIDINQTGAGVLNLGQSGDNDTTRVVGVQDFSSGSHFFCPQVTDAGPMTATNGTEGEIVYNLSDDKFYGCITTGTPATWAAFH